jgi:hypothetical protein
MFLKLASDRIVFSQLKFDFPVLGKRGALVQLIRAAKENLVPLDKGVEKRGVFWG